MVATLHHITQDNLSLSHSQQAKLALEGGAKLIQLRSKTLPTDEIIADAQIIKQLCKTASAKFILNDNWKLAIALGLDGVHVGLTDTPVGEIRNHSDFIIGGTANTFDDIKMHYSQGANYVGVGPFKHTNTKENLSPILGIEGYKKIISSCKNEHLTIPIIAIGGIQLTDIQTLKQEGVHGIAIASQINATDNPSLSTSQFLKELAK